MIAKMRAEGLGSKDEEEGDWSVSHIKEGRGKKKKQKTKKDEEDDAAIGKNC